MGLPPVPADPEEGASEEEWARYSRDMNAAGAAYAIYYQAKAECDALDKIVFKLERALSADHADGPRDFSDMLAVNARVLNAAFEYYLTAAHRSPAGDGKILMALKMQAQLTRTIDTWRRLSTFQNEQTK